MTTIAQTLSDCVEKLHHSSQSAHIDAQTLMCHVLDCNSAHIMTWPQQKLTEQQRQQLTSLLHKRVQGVPVAYLTGTREFWSLDLKVTPATLIPRTETELLVEFIVNNFKDHNELSIADLGTGSGAIAIAVASERPDWHITASDLSWDAIMVARANARQHGVTNIQFIHSNWFDRIVDKRFDLIVSNPPYVAQNDPHLKSGDLRMEPALALQSGDDGLDAIRHISKHAAVHLNPGGCLLLEHGYDQQASVRECLQKTSFNRIIQQNDYAGQPRMTAGYID